MKDINSKLTQEELVSELIQELYENDMLNTVDFLSDEDCLEHCEKLVNARIHDLKVVGCI